MIFSKPVFQLWPEVPDKTLGWPSSAVSQSADGVALNLFARFPNHINLLWLRVALSEPPHHCVHPVNTLSAGGALTTGLVLVEHCKPCNCLNHICLLVHDNDCRCPKTCLLCHQVVKVHQNFVTNRLRDEGSGAASRDDTEQIVPAADHSAAVALDQLLQGDAHLLLHCAGVVHVARDVEQLGAAIPGAAHAGEPVSSPPADGRSHGYSLHVGHSGGTAEDTDVSGEWGLQAGLALLTLQALDQGGLLTADVGASTTVHKEVEVIARATGVGSQEASVVGLPDGLLQVGGLVVELSSDVDVAGRQHHGGASHQAAFNQSVRVVPHDLAVLASSRLALVSVDHQVLGAAVVWLVHEAPLKAAGEASTTPASQTAGLDFVNDPLATLLHDLLGLVPLPALHGSLESPVMAAIDVGEDSVSISHGTELGLCLGCLASGRHQLAACSCRTLDPLEEAGAEPLLDQLGHFASLSLKKCYQA